MKRFILLLLLLTAHACACAQYFEGAIIYSNTYKSKNKEVSDQELSQMMGSRQEYVIKNGNYKSVTNGSFFQWQLYLSGKNALYNKTARSAQPGVIDASMSDEPALDVSQSTKVADTVLDYLCYELVIVSSSSVKRFYYSDKLTVNDKLYKAHSYGDWNIYLSLAKSLPLKMIVENNDFTITSEAVEIKPYVVNELEFDLKSLLK